MKIEIERAIEILDPEHRERYDDLEEVNEACRMGMAALRIVREIVESGGLPVRLMQAGSMRSVGVNDTMARATIRRAAALLEKACNLFTEGPPACDGDSCPIHWPEE